MTCAVGIDAFAHQVRFLLRAPEVLARPDRVDLNRDPAAVLALLPGIGPEKASAIVLHRVRFGRFQAVERLMDVPGIGRATVDSLRALVDVGG